MIHRTPDPIAAADALRAECDALRAEVAAPAFVGGKGGR